MKIGIYTPYLWNLGGGEKYICKIAEILSQEDDVAFIAFETPNFAELESRLSVDLSKVTVDYIQKPSLKLPGRITFIQRLNNFILSYKISKRTGKYDLFINQVNHSDLPSLARNSFYICQVPPTEWVRPSRMKNSIFTDLFFDPKLKSYDKVIVYSFFVKEWAERYYDREIEVIYPAVDTEQFRPAQKEDSIISVGRFFTRGHCKKQLEMIKAFKQLYKTNKELTNWKYHLIGGVSDRYTSQQYLRECQEEARDYPVHFHINAPFKLLKEFYGMSKIFWHATGLGEDEDRHPERMEHFGIPTIEAMSAGCVPIVINRGGQPEIVRNRIDGFLWDDVEELKEYTLSSMNDGILWHKMSQSSIERSEKFGSARFINEVYKLIEEVKNELGK